LRVPTSAAARTDGRLQRYAAGAGASNQQRRRRGRSLGSTYRRAPVFR